MESYLKADGAGFVWPEALIDWPLYKRVKSRVYRKVGGNSLDAGTVYTVNTLHLAETIEADKISFDCYCAGCKKERPFAAAGNTADLIQKQREAQLRSKAAIPAERRGFYSRMFFCAKDAAHVLFIVVKLDGEGLTKIGQFPSPADLSMEKFDYYLKALEDEEKAGEFVKASIAASFGFSIGAFVYARRVFEFLVERAEKEARDEGRLQPFPERYPPMHERIAAVADYLPEFLVQQAHVYSSLSEGIHTLDERRCAVYFPILRDGIELMLDQANERSRKVRREAETREAIAKINEEIAAAKKIGLTSDQ